MPGARWRRPLLLAVLAGGTGCAPAPPPPHVVLISIDSQRADMLSCYGYRSVTGEPTSPVLDELAAGGVLFEDVVSTTSWTLPAHHALFSGLPDILHGAVDDFHTATPDRRVLARELAQAGYATAGVYSGPYLHPAYGFAEGFDEYHSASQQVMPFDQPAAERDPARAEQDFHFDCSAAEVTRQAREFLRRRDEERPFFLFLHYFDVHYDYRPPQRRYAELFWPARQPPAPLTADYFTSNQHIHAGWSAAERAAVLGYYHGETRWVDEQIGLVLAELEALGLTANTLVVVTADHGDEFFEHGAKGHRQNLYQETTAVPLLLSWPRGLPAGRRVAARVSLVDVAPTILALVGATGAVPTAAVPTEAVEASMWGRSLLPWIEGDREDSRDAVGYLYDSSDAEQPTHWWSLWTGDHKVVVRRVFEPGRRAVRETAVEVFSLREDPAEQHNLMGRDDAAVRQALARFDELYQGELLGRAGDLRAGQPPAFDAAEAAAQRRRLEDLGYALPERVSEQPPPPRLGDGS